MEPRKITEETLAAFARQLGEEERSPATLEKYLREVRQFAAFLGGRIEWLDIVEIDAAVVGEHEGLFAPGLDDVLAVETWARTRADELIAARNGGTHS